MEGKAYITPEESPLIALLVVEFNGLGKADDLAFSRRTSD